MGGGATYDKQGGPAGPADEALLAWSCAGDSAALARLMHRYQSRLFNYAKRMLGSAEDAEDVFQETFLRVYRHQDRFRPGAAFRPWVYRIATNLCRDRLRYRGRRPQVSIETPMGSSPGAPVLGNGLAARDPDPAAMARGAETAARLEAAVAALPEKHRAVFLMARYEGLPYEEIAKVLRIPVGTVKSRMNKAVKVLLAALEDA